MEKRIKDYNSLPSVASSRFESVKKLRNEILEQQRVLAEQQERWEKQRDEQQRIQSEALEKRMREENQRMVALLLPMKDDKKVTDNRLSTHVV